MILWGMDLIEHEAELWDAVIELSPNKPVAGLVKYNSKGQAYFQRKFRMCQQTVVTLIEHQWPHDPLEGPLEVKMIFLLPKEAFEKSCKYPTEQKFVNEFEDYILTLAEKIVFESTRQIIVKTSFKLFCESLHPSLDVLVRKL